MKISVTDLVNTCKNSALEKSCRQNKPTERYRFAAFKTSDRECSLLDPRPTGRGFEPHRSHCVVSLSKNINPSLVLIQPRKPVLLRLKNR